MRGSPPLSHGPPGRKGAVPWETVACSILETTMNELGQMALEFFRTHPNLMPQVTETELVVHCRSLGAEMMTQREALRDRLFDRATEEARGPDGKSPSNGHVRAGMFRSATQEATATVLSENLWSLLEDPDSSPRIGQEWDESLMDLEVPWHPDWREMLDPSMAPVERMTVEDMAEEGVVAEDAGTWWRAMTPDNLLILNGAEINVALADGRLVWVGDEVIPRLRVERLARKAAEQNGG